MIECGRTSSCSRWRLGCPPFQVHIDLLLSFMEFLHQNGHSQPNIANYMAAIRAMHIVNGLPKDAFRDQRVPLSLKALKISAPFSPSLRTSLDISTFYALLQFCDTAPHPVIFKALYSVCFFSFLRLPHSLSTYDCIRQLARGDFISSGSNAVLLLKWSKTIQDRRSVHTIPLPNLGQSILCPIGALKAMTHAFPASTRDPLFLVPNNNGLVPLTDSVARKHLKKASLALNISPTLTFHAFRRTGASWAFSHGVPLEHIMRHGTWRSDSIWAYLSSSPSSTSPAAAAFQAALHY